MAINRTNLVALETYNRKMKTPTIVLPTQLGRHSITQKPQVQKKEFKLGTSVLNKCDRESRASNNLPTYLNKLRFEG